MELLLATGNAHKVAELRRMLAPLGIEVRVPADVGGLPEVVEDGATFAENAAKKACSGAAHAGRWCLADDSGLAVDHLGGAPGVHSARYAGTHGDDAANNAKVLRDMAGVPAEDRGARFVCALALARPDGSLAGVVEGETHGRLLEAPRGSGGFGYDPLFLFDEEGHVLRGRGFAELAPDQKNTISHRGRALRALSERWSSLTES